MMRRASIGIALLALSQLVSASAALAQAGSTGGTVGKQDKSISGVQETPASHSRAKTERRLDRTSGCSGILGVWTWRISVLSWRIVVRPNGIATHSIDNGISGTWSCKDDSAVFVWANGKYLDHVTLLPEPNRLEGTNIDGVKFTGTRQAN
jgi:hypothetical protein